MTGTSRSERLTQEEKMARNEALFREVNETIQKSAVERRFAGSEPPSFVCECQDLSCGALVQVGLAAYEDIRSNGSYFVVVKGHENPELERVVESGDTYAVVEKLEGPGKSLAEATDPRG